MKLVVTIIQNRRVALPFIFLKAALPRMRASWKGDIEVAVVQHRAQVRDENSRFASLQNPREEDLERVRHWTDDLGRFDDADDILVHHEVFPEYPLLPSVRRAVKHAIERGADFHLLLEDDALVCDEACGDWPEFFGVSEIGVFRYAYFCNSAFLVMRPSFSRRVLPGLSDYSRWSRGSRLERFFLRRMRTTRTHLNPAAAVRAHPRTFPYTGDAYVAEMVDRIAPEHRDLLPIDFGAEILTQPPVTLAMIREHASRDSAKPWDKLLQVSVRNGEELWRRVEGRSSRGPWDGGWDQVIASRFGEA